MELIMKNINVELYKKVMMKLKKFPKYIFFCIILTIGCSDNPLLEAVENRNTDKIIELLLNGADVNQKDKTKWNSMIEKTALILAAEKDFTEIIIILVENGADVRAKDNSGATALTAAVMNNHIASLNMLIKYGAQINTEKKFKRKNATVLYHTFNQAFLRNAIFPEKDFAIDPKTLSDVYEKIIKEESISVFHFPSYYEPFFSKAAGSVVIFKTFPDYEIYMKNLLGWTPLMWASLNNNIEIVEILLDNGAKVNAQALFGETALWWAVYAQNITIAKLLIERGADINSRNLVGNTILTNGLLVGWLDQNSIKFLLSEGIDVNISGMHGETALMVACLRSYFDIAKMLLESKADIYAKLRDIPKVDGFSVLDLTKDDSVKTLLLAK